MAETITQETPKKKRTAGQKVAQSATNFIWAEHITANFFKRHMFEVVVIVFLLLAYITFSYECKTKYESIARLERQLTIARSESVRLQSEFHSRTRESAMQQRVDSARLQLKVQDLPPFVLTYEP